MQHQRGAVGTKIFLDGPSALQLYRGRADILSRAQTSKPHAESSSINVDELGWLSDEDVAATLASDNVFGHRAYEEEKKFQANAEGSQDGYLLPLKRSRVRELNGCTTRSQDIKAVSFSRLGLLPHTQNSPLFLLAAKANDRRRVNNVRIRVLGSTLPAWSLMRVGKTVFVPTPELTFLLLAKHLSQRELIAVGMELCGHYRLQRASTLAPLRSRRTLYNQRTLTSPNAIKRLLDRVKGIPGVRAARRALKYVEPNSASPMETALYMLLCLPRSLGGYGLPRPVLNARRPVTREAKSFTFWDNLVPDLYWPNAHLDLEYDSESLGQYKNLWASALARHL